jgi:ATP-binding cassette subfamily B protein
VLVSAVKSFVQEDEQCSRYNAEIDGTLRLGRKVAQASGLFNGVLSGFTTLVFTVVIYFGVVDVAAGRLTTGVLTSFLLYSLTISNSLTSLAGLFSHLMKALGANERVFELLDRVPGIPVSGGHVPQRLRGDVVFRDVEFAYPTRREVVVLRRASFGITAGKVVALVGMSGAGKSTCIALLERFYDPDDGAVLVDGADIRDLDPRWLRRNIGVRRWCVCV